MKKVILSLAMLIATSASIMAVRNDNNTSTSQTPVNTEKTALCKDKKECDKKAECDKNAKCDKKKDCKKSDCKRGKKGRDGKKGEGITREQRFNRSIEGLDLTAEQTTKMQALYNETFPERAPKADLTEARKAQRKVEKAEIELSKAQKKVEFESMTAEQKAQVKADRQAAKEARKAKMAESRKNYLEGVQKILTPAQYQKFLEKNYLEKGQKVKDGGKAGKDASSKMMKKGDKSGKKAIAAHKGNKKDMKGNKNAKRA